MMDISGPASGLLSFGADAGETVVQLLASADRAQRYAACLLAPAFEVEGAAERLLDLVQDRDLELRDMAMLALLRGPREAREELLSPFRAAAMKAQGPNARRALRILGGVRDAGAAPAAVERLGDRDSGIRESAVQCLSLLTALPKSSSRFRWRRWLRSHQHRARTDWLLEALDHPEARTRLLAAQELTLLTGQDLGLHQTARRDTSRALQRAYRPLVERLQ